MICRPTRVLATSGQISSEIGEVSRQGADQFLLDFQPGKFVGDLALNREFLVGMGLLQVTTVLCEATCYIELALQGGISLLRFDCLCPFSC